jgi:hypothetical protein
MMKLYLPLLAITCFFPTAGLCADAPEPLVSVSAKRQVLDSDHDLKGQRGSSGKKVITLRVDITNTTSSPIEASTISGDALILRAIGENEKLVKESLGKVDVPALKPNEKKSVELGKITLSEVEWGKKKFEESLEEWKITCTQGQVVIGGTESSDKYADLEATAKAAGDKDVPAGPRKKRFKRPLR